MKQEARLPQPPQMSLNLLPWEMGTSPAPGSDEVPIWLRPARPLTTTGGCPHALHVCTSKSEATLGTDGAGPWPSTWLSGSPLHPPGEAVPATPVSDHTCPVGLPEWFLLTRYSAKTAQGITQRFLVGRLCPRGTGQHLGAPVAMTASTPGIEWVGAGDVAGPPQCPGRTTQSDPASVVLRETGPGPGHGACLWTTPVTAEPRGPSEEPCGERASAPSHPPAPKGGQVPPLPHIK